MDYKGVRAVCTVKSKAVFHRVFYHLLLDARRAEPRFEFTTKATYAPLGKVIILTNIISKREQTLGWGKVWQDNILEEIFSINNYTAEI